MTATAAIRKLAEVRGWLAAGRSEVDACRLAGVSRQWFRRWRSRVDAAGAYASEAPRQGRPPALEIDQAEADWLARVYLRSNRGRGLGSMTMAAQLAARDPASPLRPETRAAILALRNKHALPVALRRAMRLSPAAVRVYRDARADASAIYTPGYLRMAQDGTRRLKPGERQVWDDASVNLLCCVPWPQGGDPCSDRFGVRVARFQLLAGIDCATDHCVGISYVVRDRDAYHAGDVCGALYRAWTAAGYCPTECVLEGGAWQARQTLDLLAAAGVTPISAKGRPNQKLVEGWFGRLWTVMSALEPRGQIGRFRGEMAAETKAWMACRRGAQDPRKIFISLEDMLNLLERAIDTLNAIPVQSDLYGTWVPAEAYSAAGDDKGHPVPIGLSGFARPLRAERTVRRGGLVEVTAGLPFGLEGSHPYLFASVDGWRYEGAPVVVSFDPAALQEGATIRLARRWRDYPAGHIVDDAAPCLSAAPIATRNGGLWRVSTLDARAAGRAARKAGRTAVATLSRSFDDRQKSLAQSAQPILPTPPGDLLAHPSSDGLETICTPGGVDFAALESEAGILI